MSKPDSSRLRARVTLDDCREYYSELKAISDPNEFRRRWFGFIALLRGVGHVLNEVDREKGDRHKKGIDKHHGDSVDIFKYFIKGIRDRTIKEYRSGLFSLKAGGSSPMSVHTSAMCYEARTGMALTEVELRVGPPLPYALRGGSFKDRGVWGVIDEALAFWDDYLTKVESELEGK